MWWRQTVAVLSFVAIGVSVTACGDDAGENGTGGTSSGGSATAGSSNGGSGGAPSAGSSSAGTNSGGSGGSSGTGGSATGGRSAMGATGDPCTQNSDCSSLSDEPGECITTWSGGYCSGPCGLYLDCSGDTDDLACETVQGEKRCLVACAADRACRTGYRCDLDIFACVPK